MELIIISIVLGILAVGYGQEQESLFGDLLVAGGIGSGMIAITWWVFG